jgi:outer membrane protein OmpA-like peptidoglycan-associated protein
MNQLKLKVPLLVLALVSTCVLANAQFVQEKEIKEDEPIPSPHQQMEVTVYDADTKSPVPVDLFVKGLNSRKTVVMESIADTTFEIRNYRLYTLSCIKPGYMYYAEKFWPEETSTHRQVIELQPLAKGLTTDIRDIVFLGDKTEIYHKSRPALEEMINFMKINPNVDISIIGHVNGPDNKKSPKFYRKASIERAEAVMMYLIDNGVEAKRLTADGKGNSEMIYADPETDWQNQANRRIEIMVTNVR